MELKEQKFGIEIEMTGITRAKAAEVTAGYFGTRVKYLGTVIVAAITSRPNKHWIPTHIELGNHVRGLHNDSVILLEQVRTIDRIRLRGYVGSLSGAMMRKVDEAILVSFGVTVQRRT